eukprot:COSAG02_NODE_26727_length_626_cov_0.774194_1_plen_66_part_10
MQRPNTPQWWSKSERAPRYPSTGRSSYGESGSLGDIVPLLANQSDGEGGTTYGPWTNDSRCTLYIN